MFFSSFICPPYYLAPDSLARIDRQDLVNVAGYVRFNNNSSPRPQIIARAASSAASCLNWYDQLVRSILALFAISSPHGLDSQVTQSRGWVPPGVLFSEPPVGRYLRLYMAVATKPVGFSRLIGEQSREQAGSTNRLLSGKWDPYTPLLITQGYRQCRPPLWVKCPHR
jgi:hypothetical protein